MAEEELTDRPDGEGLPNEPDWALWDAEERRMVSFAAVRTASARS